VKMSLPGFYGNIDTVRSRLSLTGLQDEEIKQASMLSMHGAGQAFRAERFTEGKYRNFTPPRALL